MKLVIFDIDGTLARTSNVDDLCFIPTLQDHFGPFDLDTNWSNYPHVTDSGILDTLSRKVFGRPPTKAEALAFEAAFMARLRERPASEFQALPGANRMLQLLRDDPAIRLAIATGCWRASAEHKMRQAGIQFHDIPLATASEARSRVDILRLAQERIATSAPAETIYLGDADWDVRATRELGWRMIGVGDRIELLRSLGAGDCFADYTNPADVLAAIMG